MKYMTTNEQLLIAEVADILAEYGYETEAEHLGRISENEIILNGRGERHNDGIIPMDQIITEARRLAERNPRCAQALAELIGKFNKSDHIRGFITG